MFKTLVTAGLASTLSLLAAASAAMTITVQEVGNNVEIVASGTIDLTGANLFASGVPGISGGSNSGFGFIGAGESLVDVYDLAAPLGLFGTSDNLAPAQIHTGGFFGIGGDGGVFAVVEAGTPTDGPVAINATSIIENSNFTFLEITAFGALSATLPNDTITVVFGDPVTVPIPGALPLMLAGLGGIALKRRRK
ncbi:MAG: VPLPA-CTERM sorting domain-containing protein [Pseudomonadota bacterium]